MTERPAQLILASRSPRRAQLLGELQLTFIIRPVAFDETPLPGESARALVQRLARGKAALAAEQSSEGLPVLGADTVVTVDQSVLGKPADLDEALTMLDLLSGRQHEVLTAVAVCLGARCETVVSESRVWFGEFDADLARRYWQTGEPADKAGGYGIQGIGGILVRRIEGSHSGIMGLPIFETEALLRAFGLNTWQYRGA